MSRFSSRSLLLAGVLLLAGCAAQQPVETAPGALAEPVFPAVGLFYKQPSDALESDCREYDEQSVLQHCSMNYFELSRLHSRLQGSGAFHEVSVGDDDREYAVSVTLAVFDTESGKEIGNAALSGATLMVLPTVMQQTLKAEVVVSWRNALVRRYQYEIPFSHSVHLFSGVNSYDDQLADLVASRFVEDARREGVFSPEYLAGALGASDYDNDLTVPEQIADYVFIDRYRYSNPLQGVMLRFEHRQFAFDRADIFIFPALSVDWSDVAALVEGEADSVRAELGSLQAQGVFPEVSLGANRRLDWQLGDRRFQGVSFSGGLVDAKGSRFHTVVYVFNKADKLIKVRATFPMVDGVNEVPPAPDLFVQGALAGIQPPGESVFMARLRAHERQTSLNP